MSFRILLFISSIVFFSPVASSSPLNANLTWMFIRLFNDTFAEYSYDAELTKLTYDLNTAHYGFLVLLSLSINQ